MKNKDLIAALKALPQEAEVVIFSANPAPPNRWMVPFAFVSDSRGVVIHTKQQQQ